MKPIPKEIRAEVNQLAHNLALKYEYEVRDSMMTELKEVAQAGATTTDMFQKLRQYQRGRDLR